NVICGRRFIKEIASAVESGRLKEPFKPDDIRRAVPGWAYQTYRIFPWKHCLQNPKRDTTALFFYVGDIGKELPPYEERLYRLLREDDLVD
ncbi:hypothetical protein DRN86_02435, partial [Candidatus Geothermarchaeota archaeon]